MDDLIGASDRPRGKKALDSMIRLKVFVAEDRSKIYFYISRNRFFLEDSMRESREIFYIQEFSIIDRATDLKRERQLHPIPEEDETSQSNIYLDVI